ncbi:MAG: hypothetical protein JJE13_09035 [Thermoleophilia bacterium]|nr:hypothetical protein [Thermoleophilia bacterium]
MSRYVSVALVAFLACAIFGINEPAAYGGGAILIAGMVLDAGYVLACRRSPRTPPGHRVDLDKLVRVQWLAGGLGGIAIAVGQGLWGDAVVLPPEAVKLVGFCGTVAIVAIFISSLVDWFWILPRVGGIVRKAPCEESGGQKWARVTGVWFFHRAIATLIATGSVTFFMLFMARDAEGDAQIAWFLAATVTGAVTIWFQSDALKALLLSLNPPVMLGDLLRWHGDDVVVVDVSLQGAKFKVLPSPADPDEGTGYPTGFEDKSDGRLTFSDFSYVKPASDVVPPCRDKCCSINYYCRNNPKAYE